MAGEDSAVVVTLRANLKDYETALKNAVRMTEKAAKAAEAAVTNVGKNSKPNFQPINDNFQKSAGQLQQDAKVLQYQLNDVFSGIASGGGMRSLTQQLGQISQIFQGAGIGQAASTFGTALMGMISPVNIALVGITALSAAAFKYFESGEEDADALNKKLKEQADIINQVAQQWGAAFPALAAYNTELQNQQHLQQQQQAFATAQEQNINAMAKPLEELGPKMAKIFDLFKNTKYKDEIAAWTKAWDDHLKKVKAGNVTIEDTTKLQAQTNKLLNELPIPQAKKLGDEFLKLQGIFDGLIKRLTQIKDEAGRLPDKATQAVNAAVAAGNPLDRLGPPRVAGAGVWEPSQTQLEQAEEAERARIQAAEDAKRAAAQAAKERTREAERAAEEARRKLNAAIAAQTAIAVDAATSLLGKSENTNAAEINSFLKKGGVDLDSATTSWCAAFINAALAQVGIKGSGSNVATSFMGWGQKVDLQNIQRGDVLVQPRGRGEGETGGHVGFATGNLRATADGIKEVEMISGNSADKVQTQWVSATSVIARRSADAFQIPAEALKHLSEESRRAAEESKKLSQQQQQAAQQLAQQYTQVAQSAVSGLVTDLMNGVSAGEAFNNMLKNIISSLAQMAVQSLFSQQGIGSIFGALAGVKVGGMQAGGTVGLSHHMERRNPALWMGAPKFQRGGMVGLRPGEVPIIAHRGEIVIPSGRAMASSGRGNTDQSVHQTNNIKMDFAGSGYVAGSPEEAKLFGRNVQKIIQLEMVKESRPGGLLRKVPT